MKHTLFRCLLGAVLAMTVSAAQAEPPQWLSKTYTWTEDDGTVHTATYGDIATTARQIEALVGHIQYDIDVPGHKTYQGQNGQTVTMAYPRLTDNYNIPKPADITDAQSYVPREEGTTMLLVTMKSTYGKNGVQGIWSSNASAYATNLGQIQDVRVITDAVRVESTDNPGTLLNLDADLDKFFVMTKGWVNGSEQSPFIRMFEQLSPLRQAFVSHDLYAELVAGHKFPVNHVCGGCIGLNHMTCMTANTVGTSPVHVNMMFYIPDLRFLNGTVEYDRAHQPYFFAYTISQAPTAVAPSGVQANVEDVTLDWTSSLKSIVGNAPTAMEEFRVLRRVKGTTQWAHVQDSQVTIEQEGTSFDPNTTETVDRGLDGHVTIVVHEPMTPDNQELEYMIEGRMKDTEHSWIQSNVQPAYIEGYDIYSEPKLRITLNHRSTYRATDQTNQYQDRVGMRLRLSQNDVPMIRGHVSTDAQAPTRLRLMRFVDDADVRDASQGTQVAEVTLTRSETKSADGQWYVYPVTGTCAGNAFSTTLYSRVTTDPTADLAEPLLDAMNTDAVIVPEGSTDTPYASSLMTFPVDWQFSTVQMADNHSYVYRLFATGLNIENPDYADGIMSDVRTFAARTLPLEGGYTSYTLEQVTADTDHGLSENLPTVKFTVENLPLVNHAEIRAVASAEDGNTVLGRLDRSLQNGVYTYYSRWSSPEQVLEERGKTDANEGTYEFEAQRVMHGKTLEMVTVHVADANGNINTYGAPRTTVHVMPTLTVEAQEVEYDQAQQLMTVEATWAYQAPADAFTAGFARLGYRAWDGVDRYERNATPFYDGFVTPAAQGVQQAPASGDANLDTVTSSDSFTRTADPEHPATVFYTVRRYTESPWEPGQGKYIVTDGMAGWAKNADGTVTGIDDLTSDADAADGPAEWFTIQGQRLPETPVAPGVYLRRQAGKTVKVAI